MKYISFVLLLMFMICLVGAESNPCGNSGSFLGTFKQGEIINLKQICDTCSYVNISGVKYPNSTIENINLEMTKNGIDYNYTFSNTTQSGCYTYSVYGDKDGSIKAEVIDFEINPTGISSSESRTTAVSRSIYFTFGIAIILLIAFIFINSKPSIKWTFFLISMMFFLVSLNILFVGLKDEVVNPQIEGFFDIFTASFYYLFWGIFGILMVLWILTTFQTLLLKNKTTKMEKYG
jgi:hypothetical protein